MSALPAQRGPHQPARPPLPALMLAFARIGLSSFGGGNAAWIRRELVERRQWLPLDGVLAGYAMCQVLPGATTVNLAVFCGTKLRGRAGAFAACLGIVLPPMVLIVIAGLGYAVWGGEGGVRRVLAGVSAAAIGMSLQMGFSSGLRAFRGLLEWLLAGAVVYTVGWLRWPALDAIACAGPLGILLAYVNAEEH